MKLNRRIFIGKFGKCSLFVSAGSAASGQALAQTTSGSGGGTPHLFLNLCFSGGVDGTYLFDARPLKMTDAGKIANYMYKNKTEEKLKDPRPQPIHGSNGGRTLMSPLAAKFWQDHKQHFSVINGVLMNQSFDGHGNNMYTLFTNTSTNGESFIPKIGATALAKDRSIPLESLHLGGWNGDGNMAPLNFSKSARMDVGPGAAQFIDRLREMSFDMTDPVNKLIVSRTLQNANYKSTRRGMFSIGSGNLHSAFDRVPLLINKLVNIPEAPVGGMGNSEGASVIVPEADAAPNGGVIVEPGELVLPEGIQVPEATGIPGGPTPANGGNPEPEPEAVTANETLRQGLAMALNYLKNGVSSSMTIMVDYDGGAIQADAHDVGSASQQVRTAKQVLADIEYTFEQIKNESYNSRLKFKDVLTLLVTTEFGRTMRQDGKAMDETGTDHNPLTNTFIAAFKGIKPGQVFGASDLNTVNDKGELVNQHVDGSIYKVSDFHRNQKDAALIKIMGKPFDFVNGVPLKQHSSINNYIHSANVTNTIMTMFGVPEKQLFKLEGQSTPARIIKQLLG